MPAQEFHLGVLLVDDDPDIVEQHRFLLENRAFRKQTPGRVYVMLRDAGLIEGADALDAMIEAQKWPTKADLRDVLIINPDVDDLYRIVDPDVAYSAAEADDIWDERKPKYLSNEELGCYIALVDHDMPIKTGLELAEEWRPLIGGTGPGRIYRESPIIVFYTGRAPLLRETLTAEGYESSLEAISTTGLAEAVLQKGVLRDEFNQLMWSLLENRIEAITAPSPR